MSISMSILTVVISFIGMECMAWFSHKYIMHGFLWKLHKDHHQKTNHWWELNDIFVIIFAIPSFVALLFGFSNPFILAIGFGILLYGLAYFFVHEILIHNRFKWGVISENRYFRALRRAHKVHHSFLDKKPGDNFGFVFLIPLHYFKDSLKDE
jgi:beta-carotene 3-hydroxylase